MIKKIVIPVLAILLMLSATSCGLMGSPTEKYLLAMKDTQDAETLESSSKIEINLDLAKAKDTVKADLEKYKDITLNISDAVDKKAGKEAVDCYMNIGGSLVDFKIYADGNNAYIKSSILGDKYYKPERSGDAKSDEADEAENKKMLDDIKKIWVDVVKNEIISSEGTSVENTPDGDIKVTNLALELNDEKGKNIITKLADIVSKNKFILEQAKKGSNLYAPKDLKKDEADKKIEKWFQDLPENIRNRSGQYTIDKLKITARVDKDSNIINQLLEGGVTIKSDEKGEIKIGFKFEENYWNINRKVNVKIPQIKKEDIGDWKELDKKFAEGRFNIK